MTRRITRVSGKLKKLKRFRSPARLLGRAKKLTEKQLRYLFAVVFKKDRKGRLIRQGILASPVGGAVSKSQIKLIERVRRAIGRGDIVSHKVLSRAFVGAKIDDIERLIDLSDSPYEIGYFFDKDGIIRRVGTAHNTTSLSFDALIPRRYLRGAVYNNEKLAGMKKMFQERGIVGFSHNHSRRGVPGLLSGRVSFPFSSDDVITFVRSVIRDDNMFVTRYEDMPKRIALTGFREVRAVSGKYLFKLRLTTEKGYIRSDKFAVLRGLSKDYKDWADSYKRNFLFDGDETKYENALIIAGEFSDYTKRKSIHPVVRRLAKETTASYNKTLSYARMRHIMLRDMIEEFELDDVLKYEVLDLTTGEVVTHKDFLDL